VYRTGQAEIQDYDALVTDDDVAGLEIAMQYAGVVQRTYAASDLIEDRDNAFVRILHGTCRY
jgi:hypothetical protein